MKRSDTVKLLGGEYVWIDTCYTFDRGWETMVFESDESGNVKNWIDLDSQLYYTEEQASRGHDTMVEKWKNRWSVR